MIGQIFRIFPPFVPPTGKETLSHASGSLSLIELHTKVVIGKFSSFDCVQSNMIHSSAALVAYVGGKKSMRSTSRSQLRIIHFIKIN